MDEELRRFIIRGHEKVIGHCHFLLASPNLRDEDRGTLESRLAAEERALRGLTSSDGDYFPSSFRTAAAEVPTLSTARFSSSRLTPR